MAKYTLFEHYQETLNLENFYFNTNEFLDPPNRLAQNCNGIGGYELAITLKATLSANGFLCNEVFDEDYGWAFEATSNDIGYFISASVDPVDDETASRHKFFANINVDKDRSFMDKLKGRNKLTVEDKAIVLIRCALETHPDVVDLKSSL
jgi:hypothetical protein